MPTRTLLGLLFLVLLTPVGSWASDPPIDPDKQILMFETKIGTVTFRHQNHADLSFTTCTTCHHTYQGEGPIKSCHECHNDSVEDPKLKAKGAFHVRCAGCHEYTLKEGLLDHAGPLKTKCKLCHIK